MPHLTFHLFGAPRVQRNGAPVRIIRRRAVACAVYLAVTGQEVSRDALAAFFWPETDPTNARADLRRTLHLLHQALGYLRLVAEQGHVRFQRDDDLWLDVEHFRHLMAACQSHGHTPQEVCPDCLPLLAAAAVLIVALGIAAEAMTRRGIQLALATAPAPRAAQRSEDARPQTVHDLRPDSIRSLDKLSRLLDFHRATPPATGQGDRSPSSPGARLPFDGTTGGDTHV